MINSLNRLTLRSRAASVVFSLLALVIAGFAGWYAHRESHRWPKSPATMTLTSAVAGLSGTKRYVTLEDSRWHCDRAVKPTRDRLYVPLTGPGDSILVFASFDESVTCDSAKETRAITGVLSVLERKRPKARARLVDPALDLAPARDWEAPVYELCTYCGPSQVKPAIWLCVMFTIIGLGFYPLTQYHRASVERERTKPVGSAETVGVGLLLATLGVVGVFIGRDWAVGGIIPVPWIAGAEAAFGLWIMLFPNHPRVRAIMAQMKQSSIEDAGG